MTTLSQRRKLQLLIPPTRKRATQLTLMQNPTPRMNLHILMPSIKRESTNQPNKIKLIPITPQQKTPPIIKTPLRSKRQSMTNPPTKKKLPTKQPTPKRRKLPTITRSLKPTPQPRAVRKQLTK
jgi:hypothetical protein